MPTLERQLNGLKNAHSQVELSIMASTVLSTAIMILLREQRFLGEVYLQLERQVDWQLSTPLAIGYHQQHVVLFYHPSLMQTRVRSSGQMLSMLEHQAMHLVFKHPLRYPEHDQWVDLATDLTINQYQRHPAKDLQLPVFNHHFGLQLPPLLGSNQYLILLKQALTNSVPKLTAGVHGDHQKWGTFQSKQPLMINGQLQNIVQKAWQNTDNQSRGMMDTTLVDQIRLQSPQKQVSWQRYLKWGIGTALFANQETLARFDRRQPYRMDLHGTIPNWLQNVNVFVDNSGSMSDDAVQTILSQVAGLLKQFHPTVTLISFDSKLHLQSRVRLHNANQIKYQRYSGGGTSFQIIFDWLATHHGQNNLNVILTDGYGEQHLNYHEIKKILWILTQPKRQFSVQNIRGTVISLKKEG